MFAMVAGWLAESALMTSPAGGFLRGGWTLLKRVPAPVWDALLIVALITATVFWVRHEMHRAYANGHKDGYAQAVADIKVQQEKLATQYKGVKAAADSKAATSTEKVRKTHATTTAHIDRNLADLFSLYDSAADRRRGGPDAGVHGANGAAGPGRTQASTADGLAKTAAADPGLIAITAKPLYVGAAQCDRDYAALTAWEDQYLDYMQAYDDWKAAVVKVHPQ